MFWQYVGECNCCEILVGVTIIHSNYPWSLLSLHSRAPSPQGGRILMLWDTVLPLQSLIWWYMPLQWMVMLSRYARFVETIRTREWVIPSVLGRVACCSCPSSPLASPSFSTKELAEWQAGGALTALPFQPELWSETGRMPVLWICSLQRDQTEYFLWLLVSKLSYSLIPQLKLFCLSGFSVLIISQVDTTESLLASVSVSFSLVTRLQSICWKRVWFLLFILVETEVGIWKNKTEN